MRQLIFVCFLTVLTFSVSATEITCQSQGAAHCVTNDGMCLDFFEMPGSDADMWEGICGGFEGEFIEGQGCPREGVVMSCLNLSNMMMPLTHFNADADLEGAQMMCTMMGGSVCPQ